MIILWLLDFVYLVPTTWNTFSMKSCNYSPRKHLALNVPLKRCSWCQRCWLRQSGRGEIPHLIPFPSLLPTDWVHSEAGIPRSLWNDAVLSLQFTHLLNEAWDLPLWFMLMYTMYQLTCHWEIRYSLHDSINIFTHSNLNGKNFKTEYLQLCLTSFAPLTSSTITWKINTIHKFYQLMCSIIQQNVWCYMLS